MTRFNFQPYTTAQLEQIVKARLASAKEGLPEGAQDVIAPDGIKFAAMKVSSISGDARRVLDICRRTAELVQPRSKTARIDDVKQVIKDMQNSPTAAYIRDLSLHERIMLAAMLKCVKREGVEEIRWGEASCFSRTLASELLIKGCIAENSTQILSKPAGWTDRSRCSAPGGRAFYCTRCIISLKGHVMRRRTSGGKKARRRETRGTQPGAHRGRTCLG